MYWEDILKLFKKKIESIEMNYIPSIYHTEAKGKIIFNRLSINILNPTRKLFLIETKPRNTTQEQYTKINLPGSAGFEYTRMLPLDIQKEHPDLKPPFIGIVARQVMEFMFYEILRKNQLVDMQVEKFVFRDHPREIINFVLLI